MSAINVLIVEDNAIIAESLSVLLQKQHLSVTGICATGEDAILQIKKNPPDLILMDIKLSGKLDGIDAAAIVGKTHRMPVIYLSDFTDEDTVARAKYTMPANFLAKPFNEADLIRAIEIAFHNATSSEKSNSDHLLIKTKDLRVKLTLKEILYLKADRSYSEVVTDNKTYKLSKNMKHIHELISHPDFVQVSRSSVVNVTAITALNGNMIQFGDREVQMTNDYKENLLKHFKVIR